MSEDLCWLAVTGYDLNDPRGLVVKIRCENYSIYTLDCEISDGVVNNVVFMPSSDGEDYWHMEVQPLSNKDGEIIFRRDLAEEYGITAFDYVRINLWVRNKNNWMDYPIYQGEQELYPTEKLSGEGLEEEERKKVPGEKTIADESKFTFTILQTQLRDNGDYVLKACIENKTYEDLTFIWDDVYVNGVLVDPFWSTEVPSGMIRYEDITFSAEDLQKAGVSAVTDVRFTMTAFNTRDWLSYSIYTETSVYRP